MEAAMASVLVRGGGGLRKEIVIGDRTLVADEPTELGGTDEGPTPYELLLGALGACTAMTVTMYARRKGWPLTGVTVELENDRIHASDCEKCETQEGYLDRIHVRIGVDGPLHEEQRARLEEIARKCPVHKTLTSELRVDEELSLAAYM
jgi:putative redox protein